jgi:hypothetical protein
MSTPDRLSVPQLAMGCRHAPQVVRGRTAVGSPPPLVDTGVDGSIST